jgi:hypothetical protein
MLHREPRTAMLTRATQCQYYSTRQPLLQTTELSDQQFTFVTSDPWM